MKISELLRTNTISVDLKAKDKLDVINQLVD